MEVFFGELVLLRRPKLPILGGLSPLTTTVDDESIIKDTGPVSVATSVVVSIARLGARQITHFRDFGKFSYVHAEEAHFLFEQLVMAKLCNFSHTNRSSGVSGDVLAGCDGDLLSRLLLIVLLT